MIGAVVLIRRPPHDGQENRPVLADHNPRVATLQERELMALPGHPGVERDEHCAIRDRKIALLDDDRRGDEVARVL